MPDYILFDSKKKRDNLLPLTFTRPIAEIRCGILTLKEKWAYYLNTDPQILTIDYLQPKWNSPKLGIYIFIDPSYFPDTHLAEAINKLAFGEVLLDEHGETIAFSGKFNQDIPDPGLLKPVHFSSKTVAINYPWDIFTFNHQQISADYKILTKGKKSKSLSATNTVIGSNPVFLEEGAKAECSVFNTTDGPVYLGKDSEVMEGCLIRGPFSLGEHSQVKMGAKIYTGTTIGPHCKVGGEINNSVFFGYSNKAHDGFLGNAVIGEWCNLGADTNNSNLKNNYEMVKVWNYTKKGFISTGLQFCGLIMGDHSKCGINTMFNTGTVVGVSSNIFGDGFPRNFIPSFSWGGAAGFTTYQINKAVQTAKLVMSRRNIEFSDADYSIFEKVFEITSEYRNK